MMETKDRPQTREQRKILRLDRDNPDWTPKDIANAMTVGWISPQYCKRIIEDMELEQNSSPTIGNMANVTKKNTDDETNDEQETEPEPEAEVDPTAGNEPVQYTSRPFSSLGSKTQDMLNYIEDNPDARLADVQEDIDSSPSYIKDVIIRHSEFIDDDAGVWEDIQNPRTVHSVDEIDNDLTTRIINTIQENPTETKRGAANIADVSENHFGHIMESYEHLLPEEWCERFPSLSDGGKLPYNEGDDAAKNGSLGGKESGPADTTNRNGNSSSTASADSPTVTTDVETEEEMNETMDSLFDEDGFLQTANLQTKDTTVSVGEAEEPETEDDEVEEFDDLMAIDLTGEDGFWVEPEDVDRLRQEAESLPDHLSSEMEGYKAGIHRALEALNLED